MKESSLVRDRHSKGVSVADEIALSEYKKLKKVMREKNNKIDFLENRLSRLEGLVADLLKQKQ